MGKWYLLTMLAESRPSFPARANPQSRFSQPQGGVKAQAKGTMTVRFVAGAGRRPRCY
jgi:hypothetical protein